MDLLGNCQKLEQECCHQIASSCPRGHHQLLLTQWTKAIHCRQKTKAETIRSVSDTGGQENYETWWCHSCKLMSRDNFSKSILKQGNEAHLCGCYLAFTMASTVFCSCELSCPDAVSTLLVTLVIYRLTRENYSAKQYTNELYNNRKCELFSQRLLLSLLATD